MFCIAYESYLRCPVMGFSNGMDVIVVVIGSFIVWQSSHPHNRFPHNVSFRHIQDLVYFVGDDPEKGHFSRFFLAISSVYYATAHSRRRSQRTARECCEDSGIRALETLES
jgi:hypothetical protein